jgi:hypothetical protein
MSARWFGFVQAIPSGGVMAFTQKLEKLHALT